jgi:hypothetical protein
LGFSGFVSFMLALRPTNDLLTLSISLAFEIPPEPYSTVQRFGSYCLSSLDLSFYGRYFIFCHHNSTFDDA